MRKGTAKNDCAVSDTVNEADATGADTDAKENTVKRTEGSAAAELRDPILNILGSAAKYACKRAVIKVCGRDQTTKDDPFAGILASVSNKVACEASVSVHFGLYASLNDLLIIKSVRFGINFLPSNVKIHS